MRQILRLFLRLCLLLACGVQGVAEATASPSEQGCLDAFHQQVLRIEREQARKRPAPGERAAERAAEQAWAAATQAALEKASQEAEACSRALRAAPGSRPAERERSCAIRFEQASEQLARSQTGRRLNAAEQEAVRKQERQLQEERKTCLGTGQPR